MIETLPAALHRVSDGPMRLQAALQRSARHLRSGATTGIAAVGSPLPPLLLDGGLGPLLSERLRALLSRAAAPPEEADGALITRVWAPPPGAAALPAPFMENAAPAPHLAPLPSMWPQQPHRAGALDFSAAKESASVARAAAPSAARATDARTLSGAALLRDRLKRALAAPPAAQRAALPRPALHTGARHVAPTAARDEANTPTLQGFSPQQAMTAAETEAALRAFVGGKPVAGRTYASELLQTNGTPEGGAASAANGASAALGAGSRSTLAPSAHFSPQGFVFAKSEGAAAPTPEALAETLATILRTQARAHGIELP